MAPTLTSFANSFNNRLEEPVRQHLKNVYACLTGTCFLATIGSYLFLTGWLSAGLLPAIASLGLVMGLMMTSDDDKNFNMRLSMLLGFGFCSGLGMGPLLGHVAMINPSLIVTALVSTTVIFVSFSICAMLADRGSWLFLGGTLISLLNIMALTAIANIFMQSSFIYQSQLYIGLFVMCAFVLYDTQAIIEKRRAGSRDYIGHSLDLFIDFIGVFRRLLIILAQKEEQGQRKRKNSN